VPISSGAPGFSSHLRCWPRCRRGPLRAAALPAAALLGEVPEGAVEAPAGSRSRPGPGGAPGRRAPPCGGLARRPRDR
jgi:hypothetical protein